jgi:hypothetical protein
MLYHGSNVSGLCILKPKPSSILQGIHAIFATPRFALAACFIPKWDDSVLTLEIEQDDTFSTYIVLRECKPNVLHELFNVDGYIYSVPDSGFINDSRLGMPYDELFCKRCVRIVDSQYIPNVIVLLRTFSNVKLIYHHKSTSMNIRLK